MAAPSLFILYHISRKSQLLGGVWECPLRGVFRVPPPVGRGNTDNYLCGLDNPEVFSFGAAGEAWGWRQVSAGLEILGGRRHLLGLAVSFGNAQGLRLRKVSPQLSVSWKIFDFPTQRICAVRVGGRRGFLPLTNLGYRNLVLPLFGISGAALLRSRTRPRGS